jgi:hypothetical protein
MAAIVITVPSSGTPTNPTNLYMPYNRAGIFQDSPLQSPTSDQLFMIQSSVYQGLYLDNTIATQNYKIGDIDVQNLGTSIEIDPIAGTIAFNGSNLIAATAGSPNGHLKISIGGNPYKIQLLNV